MEFAQLTPGRGFMPAKSVLYYSQRMVIQRALRESIASSLATLIRLRYGPTGLNQPWPQNDGVLADLRRDGFVSLDPLLDRQQIADIESYLADRRLFARRPDGSRQTFELAERPGTVTMADYQLDDIVAAPHILAVANSPFLLGLAERYIGCKPTLSALVLRWSFPGEGQSHGLQAFHRDSDDWRHLKVFVYLTEVDESAGPHVYVKRTHRARVSLRAQAYDEADIARQFPPEARVAVTGMPGASFACDTAGIHKGAMPTAKPRLMLQIQYSLLPCHMYRYRPRPYHGPLKIDPYINRLLLT
ncbi:hypothetical protein V5738_09735 [Salinisphaera sp. SPP-AMP-43]|uniref:hypothetical protein n=1 Tax=Salinisphaera sp. SPP-AMP-43 TaxID=3121288 RepID=UPI003C6E5921